MENLFDICLESVTCDYVSEGFKDALKRAGTIASDAAKNAGNLIIRIINTIINTIRKCVNTISNKFRKFRGLEIKEFEKKDFIKYRFKTSTFKKKSEETSNHKKDYGDTHQKILKHIDTIDNVRKANDETIKDMHNLNDRFRKNLNKHKELNKNKEYDDMRKKISRI